MKQFNSIKYNDIILEYMIVRSKRKTIGISVLPDGTVKIMGPMNVSDKKIREIVEQKAPWIINVLEQQI